MTVVENLPALTQRRAGELFFQGMLANDPETINFCWSSFLNCWVAAHKLREYRI